MGTLRTRENEQTWSSQLQVCSVGATSGGTASTCRLSAAATCSTRSSKTSAPRLSAKHKRLPEHEGNGIILTAKYTMVIRQQRDQQRGMRWGRVCEIIEVERKG